MTLLHCPNCKELVSILEDIPLVDAKSVKMQYTCQVCSLVFIANVNMRKGFAPIPISPFAPAPSPFTIITTSNTSQDTVVTIPYNASTTSSGVIATFLASSNAYIKIQAS